MFGYVSPLKCELRVRELTEYEGWYCGLCKTISRRYGQLPRLALSYDCAFLALLLAGVSGEGEPMKACSCMLKPLRKPRPMAGETPALDYAADANVLLSHEKLLDDWHDERSLKGLFGSKALASAARRAGERRPKLHAAIQTGIANLSKEEKAGCDEIDRVADAFATLLREILTLYPGLKQRERLPLSWLGYHLGRWIYLMDAWEDREKDEQSGAYNPFLITGLGEDQASFLLYASLSEMEKAYDLMDIKCHEGLLNNIIHLGCRGRTRALLGGTGAGKTGDGMQRRMNKEKAGR